MNPLIANLGVLLNNPHFRYPLIGVLAIQLAEIWLPQYKDQLNASQKLIMFYVMAAAANSMPSQPTQPKPDETFTTSSNTITKTV